MPRNLLATRVPSLLRPTGSRTPAARDPGRGITLMTGGGSGKSRWFWVKSSTRSVADMMSSFSGSSLCGRQDTRLSDPRPPGRGPLPSQPLSAPILVAKVQKKWEK